MDNWDGLKSAQRALWATFLFFTPASVWLAIVGIRALADGRYFPATTYLSTAPVLMIAVIATGVILGNRRRTAATQTGKGTFAVTVSPVVRLAYTVAFPLALLASASFALGLLTHPGDYPSVSASLRSVFIAGATGLAVFCMVVIAAAVFGRIRLPALAATSTSVTLGDYWRSSTVAWAEIVAVTPLVRNNNAAINIALADGSVSVIADLFPTGCRPLLTMLRFYLEHPEARPELDDGRAYERMRALT